MLRRETTLQVLVIDEDPAVRARVTSALEGAGHHVTGVDHADGALRGVFDRRPDLIVLEVRAWQREGWSILARIRECCTIPVVVLTRDPGELDVVRALTSGADDVLAKPFRRAELLARMDAVIRRARPEAPARRYDDGFLQIDFERRAVSVAGTAVRLTPLEFRLLTTLVRHTGQVLSRDQLLELVWGRSIVDQGDEVRVYIRYLRRKLQSVWPHDDPIETVRGFGYAYAPPVPARAVAVA